MSWSWWWTPKYWYTFEVWQEDETFVNRRVYSRGPMRLTADDADTETVDLMEAYQGAPFTEITAWRWNEAQSRWIRVT